MLKVSQGRKNLLSSHRKSISHREKAAKVNHSFHKYVNYVPGTGEFEDEQDINCSCSPENNSLEHMWIQKRAITARGLVRVSSLPHRALVLSNPPETPPEPLPVLIPHFMPMQGEDLKSVTQACLSHRNFVR